MISIIIPCYNVAGSIGATLESVLNQTDSDWEIIAVNDGSTDDTPRILESYKTVDKRIKLINKKNEGVSAARNTGIKEASGEWLYFLDGDDRIAPTLVESIHRLPESNEVAIFNFVKIHPEFQKKYKIKSLENILCKFLLNNETIHISSLAVKYSLIESKNICFDNHTYYGEDREFIVKCLLNTTRIVNIPDILFYYQIRDGSAMSQKTYNSKRFSAVQASERIFNLLEFTPAYKAALISLQFTIIRHFKLFHDSKERDQDYDTILNSYITKYCRHPRFFNLSKLGIYTYFMTLLSSNRNLLLRMLKFY